MARSFKWIYANCCLCRWCPGVAERREERRRQRARLQKQYLDEFEDEELGHEEVKKTLKSNTVDSFSIFRPIITRQDGL